MNQPILHVIRRWWDNETPRPPAAPGIDWPRLLPFIALHLGCLGVFWTGWSTTALQVAVVLYVARMFGITAGYHRYFSHRSFRTSRAFQLVLAVLGAASAQRGPIWWASHHRRHHARTDREGDPHSPLQDGFLHSHMGWFLSPQAFETDRARVRDLLRFPELVLLDRFDALVPLALAAGLAGWGEYLAMARPDLGTSGPQLLVWGFFVSTVVLFHVTVAVNSAGHLWGRRPFDTRDNSRNHWALALLTLGEGWHNNHHRYPASARQGFRWWELDPTYWVLRILASAGIVRDLKPVPAALRRPTSDTHRQEAA